MSGWGKHAVACQEMRFDMLDGVPHLRILIGQHPPMDAFWVHAGKHLLIRFEFVAEIDARRVFRSTESRRGDEPGLGYPEPRFLMFGPFPS